MEAQIRPLGACLHGSCHSSRFSRTAAHVQAPCEHLAVICTFRDSMSMRCRLYVNEMQT